MNNERFILEDYYDMLNLHKALLEAKFHQNPDNLYVAGSPIVAKIHNKLLDVLQYCEKKKKGQENWSEWRKIKNQKFYRDRAVRNLIKYEDWRIVEDSEKKEIVYNYCSPFTLSEDDMQEILNEINELCDLT